MRITDLSKVTEATRFLLKDDSYDATTWVDDTKNIVLENEFGDLALFEPAFVGKNIYSGHYYFKSRGRQAILAGKNFLDEVFQECYNIRVVLGLVPINHKPARWITRQIGFTSYGFEVINDKEYELFILTKKEFYNE